ncbi:threonine 3-dehydrogenase NAD(P)-binding protein [Escherichia coli]|uniref:Threonine 3-dehydrogenase NAD(P)-binding protein n=1 Tax=Escherichia coli TaxID=562 RepID=A0A376TXZ7_ECOLX|nr:threonine 3-dehydrogenase NAD(P)-binding protein [Escherichia coli]
MKALSKLKAEEGIWMTDVPVPELGHNDLLIKIRKTAICGTDVHIYNWDEWSQKTIPVPMVVGHEYVGEVVGIGQEVKGFKNRRSRFWRRPYHLRSLSQLSWRSYPSVPQHDRRRR